jgi:hypothetical protein
MFVALQAAMGYVCARGSSMSLPNFEIAFRGIHSAREQCFNSQSNSDRNAGTLQHESHHQAATI